MIHEIYLNFLSTGHLLKKKLILIKLLDAELLKTRFFTVVYCNLDMWSFQNFQNVCLELPEILN